VTVTPGRIQMLFVVGTYACLAMLNSDGLVPTEERVT
jgi:hypothetical protein